MGERLGEAARRPLFAWQTVPGTTTEMQVDDSCEVGDVLGCSFPSPEWAVPDLTVDRITPGWPLPVNESAPVGRRYYWRVRGCTEDACSSWSPVRYIDVGRQKSDFDGDGYADVVLGNQGNTATRGRVLVGFGPVPSRRTVLLQDAELPGTADHFGLVAEPLGDLDADGFADLLVTAPGDSQSLLGQAFVYFGSERFSEFESHSAARLRGDEPADGFGRLAGPAGDVDADGFQDFVVNATVTGTRALRLYRGLGRRVIPTDLVWQDENPVAFSAGDVNGDGYSDLFAVNARRTTAYHALYYLLRGGPGGLDDPELAVERDGYPMPAHTIMADVNGDGTRELGLVDDSAMDLGGYRIAVSLGGDPPSLETAFTWGGGLVPGPDADSYAELGGPIAAGDVNGDGFDDGLVGVGWHLSTRIEANLYFGGRGARAGPDATFALRGELLFISYGVPTAPGDVNGDGFDDVFLKDDFRNTGALFLGGAELDAVPDDQIVLPFE
jgi:hypothetical protein